MYDVSAFMYVLVLLKYDIEQPLKVYQLIAKEEIYTAC